jgi:hypothetical protein
LRSELEKLYKVFREEVDARETTCRKKISDDLTAMGITGNAVVPNLDAWDEWQEEIEKAGDVFGKNMEALKAKIRAAKDGRP